MHSLHVASPVFSAPLCTMRWVDLLAVIARLLFCCLLAAAQSAQCNPLFQTALLLAAVAQRGFDASER